MISELLQHKNYLSSYYDREKMLISSAGIYDYPKQRQAVVWYNVERFHSINLHIRHSALAASICPNKGFFLWLSPL